MNCYLHLLQFPSAAASPLGMGPGPGPDGLMPAGYYPPRSGQPGPSGTTSQSSPISGYILGLVTKFSCTSSPFPYTCIV